MKYLLFPLLLVCQLQAQEVLFDGHVYDHTTKKPIPYVNLSFLNTLKGTSTDDEGHFFMDLPKAYLEKQVHISSLGYKDTIVRAQQIFDLKRFEMVEESFELDEVVVSEALGNSDVLNPIGSNQLKSGFSSSSTPWILALYFPNIGAQKKYIEKVTVFLNKNEKFQRGSAKFRIRIYDVDEHTKKPKRDLIRKSIVLEHDVEEAFVSLDLSASNIEIPQSGVYIGLEWLFLASNWYTQLKTNPITNKNEIEDRFAPTFGGVYTPNQNFKVMIYGMGEWTDFKVRSRNNQDNFVPAITLKIKKE
jgi:hypothetical protein